MHADSPPRLIFFDYAGRYEKEIPMRFLGASKFNEFARRERGDIVLALADADKPDGQAELGGDGDGRASLGRPVDLGQEDPRQAGEFKELAGLDEGVLADRRVEDEQGFQAGLGQLADDDPLDLLELGHEVRVRVDAARRVDEEDLALLGLERLGGVEDDGRGVGPVGTLDDGDAELLAPERELFLGRGPEGVGGREHDPPAVAFVPGGELSGRGRLAATVDADHQDDRLAGAGRRPSVRGGEQGDELILEDALEPGLVLGLARLRPERHEDPVGGRDADVGEDERLLEAVQDLLAALAAAEKVLDLAEGVLGPGQFFLEASEHGLFLARLIVQRFRSSL